MPDSREIDDLVPEMRPKVRRLLDACRARGCEMRPSYTLRTPDSQARLWRQSRSREEIRSKIAELRRAGATHLADIIERVGPQNGDPVTNAIPGYSWHQWRESVDCFWLVDGQAVWSTTRLVNGVNGYRVYAQEAERLGLTAGGHWPRFKDWPHVQLRAESNPGRLFSLQQINDEMAARFP